MAVYAALPFSTAASAVSFDYVDPAVESVAFAPNNFIADSAGGGSFDDALATTTARRTGDADFRRLLVGDAGVPVR